MRAVLSARSSGRRSSRATRSAAISRCTRRGAMAPRRSQTMAEACIERGHRPSRHHRSFARPADRQRHDHGGCRAAAGEIDALNVRFEGRFRVFKGVEANILADGTLDLQPTSGVGSSSWSPLRIRDFAATRIRPRECWRRCGARRCHSRPSARAHVQQPRRRAAPTGRASSRRPPRRGVAVEIDGNWHRQDLDFVLAAQALDAGCLFALDSDAHSPRRTALHRLRHRARPARRRFPPTG